MTRRLRIPRRLGVAIGGAAFMAAGFAVVAASGDAFLTSESGGYSGAPSSYDISGGPVTITFSFTTKNLTNSTIITDVEFDATPILTYDGTDVTSGYPAFTSVQLGAGGTTQDFSATVRQYLDSVSFAPGVTVPLSFSLTEDGCGYYQMDAFGSPQSDTNSGLFTTGFLRVVGCTPAPTPTPTPTPTPSPSGSASPGGGIGAGSPTPTPSPSGSASPSGGIGAGSPTPSPSTSPGGGVAAASTTPTPTGGVGAVSTPGTGAAAPGSPIGVTLILVGAALVLGSLLIRRSPQSV